ncbi:hypothetical protein GCM10022409_28430 [Hymenobacter glaciei]|uniref:Adhesin domain-containing protein n=1 Tax=Hymenobacter glaciei TaxID=877209 RepID=A0ABP7UD01_9BACT
MHRLLFLLLAMAVARPAAAQKIIEKTASVTAGQRVFLDLRQATSIRVRTGAAGQMSLKATVSINQNRLNDALQLTVTPAADQLRVTADFDKEMLKQAQPGDCASYDDHGRGHNVWYGQQVCDDIAYEITLPANVALRVFTYSGNVDIVGFSNAIEAKSLSGFIDVSWPATKGAELSLKTLNGEVYTDQDIAFSTALRRNPDFGYWLQGTLKGSGPVVKLESISNDVYFRKRK